MSEQTTAPEPTTMAEPTATEPAEPPRRFEDGYEAGKAAAHEALLQEFGVSSAEELRGKLAGETQQPADSASVAESEEYLNLARENLEMRSKLDALERDAQKAGVLADQARVEKIKSLARGIGVGEKQLDQFAKLFGSDIALSDDGEGLVVLATMSDGNRVPSPESAEKYLERITSESPWFLAPKQPGGAGNPDQISSTNQGAPIKDFFDRRSFSERTNANRGTK